MAAWVIAAVSLAGTIHCARSAIRSRRLTRPMWVWLTLAGLLFTAAWLLQAAGVFDTRSARFQAVIAASFVSYAGANVVILGTRRPGRVSEAVLDGMAVGVALSTLLWEGVLQPEVGVNDGTLFATVWLVRIHMDAILVVTTLLLVGSARHLLVARLMALASAWLLVTDVGNLLLVGLQPPDPLTIGLVQLLSAVVLLYAVVHPSARRLMERGAKEYPTYTPRRLSTLAALVSVPAVGLLLAGGAKYDQRFYGIVLILVVAGGGLRVRKALIDQAAEQGALIEAQSELAHLGSHDPLTGLPNRRAVTDLLAELLRERHHTGGFVAACFMDLDDFKRINDALGHEAGDETLRRVARRLLDAAGDGATVARFGGDEFVVVIAACDGRRAATETARTLRDAVGTIDAVRGQQIRIAASVGVSVSDSSRTPQAMLRDADAAMYVAKASTAGVAVFDDDMRRRLLDDLALEQGLRKTLRNRSLDLAFQPVVALPEREVVGYEALARWRDPARGAIAPDVFVPIAERCGVIGDLGHFVATSAVARWAHWPAAARPQLALNVAGLELLDPTYATRFIDLLDRHGLPGDSVVLELTERDLLQDIDLITEVLSTLRGHGVRIAVDDFGTGYFSLSQLQQVPVDVLKIDRSFVTGVADRARDRAIVAAVCELGRGLGLEVIAEGVETETQLHELVQLGVTRAQGYLLGRPGPDPVTARR